MALRIVVCVCASLLISPAASALTINLNMGANLLADPGAVADFDNAAHLWESIFSDPVTVNIDADLITTLPAGQIGGAIPVYGLADFNSVISRLKSDADPDDGILAALPDASQFRALVPQGFGLSIDMLPTKANMKAMGFTGVDALYGASDGLIDFNSNFAYDYDPSNGIDADKLDFTATAIHEIGHVLGFYSSERVIDADLHDHKTADNIGLAPLDLFRFPANAAPSSAADFTSFVRDLYSPDSQVFSDTKNVWAMSTGTYYGDGEDPSHWLDDNGDPAQFIGIMDPTADFGEGYDRITYADIRALDLIGWDYTPGTVPEPCTLALFGIGLGGLRLGRRQRIASLP